MIFNFPLLILVLDLPLLGVVELMLRFPEILPYFVEPFLLSIGFELILLVPLFDLLWISFSTLSNILASARV